MLIDQTTNERVLMPKSAFLRSRLTLTFAAAPTLAMAHTGVGSNVGFVHGFVHPIGGIDHVLAMVAVGMFAVNLARRALWAVPLTFMALMAVGGAAGILGMPLPHVELGIALSIVVFGLLVATRLEWPVTAAMALVGLFAIFHGHAHGSEMPIDASVAAYAFGFLVATGLLHLTGVAIGFGIAAQAGSRRITQVGGSEPAAVGLMMLGGIF
jgi:urease accessory protein